MSSRLGRRAGQININRNLTLVLSKCSLEGHDKKQYQAHICYYRVVKVTDIPDALICKWTTYTE